MTGPVWDGHGEDPWLPERVNNLLRAQTAENLVYATVWEELSAWLVTTLRRILGGPMPQPEEVFTQTPAWDTAVTRIIETAIVPVMDWAYAGLMGEGFSWRERGSITNYLLGVRNRLLRIPEEVFGLVTGQLAAGVTLGEGIPALADRVDNVLSTTKSERWPNRAVVIARTETLGALNASRTDAFNAYAEETGDELERIWLATVDSRTRPAHRAADGQRVGLTDPFIVGSEPLMFPGDPSGSAGNTIQCRCTTLLVEPGESIDLSNRQSKARR